MTPAVAGDAVYIATRNGAFYMVSASGQEVLANIATKAVEPIAAAALVVGDRAYFADRKGTAFCIDLQNKTVAWKRQLETGKTVGVFDDPVAAGKAILFFGKSSIYALSATDGTPLYAPIRNVASAPCVLGTTAWYGGKDNSFVALDAATGKVAATVEAGAPIVGRPAASGNNVVFPLASGAAGVVDSTRALAAGGKR
jgi:outer membrane protein assembly factor BamB